MNNFGLSNAIDDFNKSMESIYDPMKGIQEQMEMISNPMKKFQEQMEIISNPMKQFQEQMEIISNPLKNINSIITPELTKLNEFYKNINLSLHTEHISKINDLNIDNLVQEIIVKTDNIDYQVLQEDIDKNSRVVDGQVKIEQLEELKEDILNTINLNNLGLEKDIENLTNYIKKQNNPFMVLIYPIILGLIINFMSSFFEKNIPLYNNPQYITKKVSVNIKKTIPQQSLSNFRLVKCDLLNVRIGKSTKKQIIGYLSRNDLVEIIKKNKNWTLIKYTNSENDTMIQGWVFTRYLLEIK